MESVVWKVNRLSGLKPKRHGCADSSFMSFFDLLLHNMGNFQLRQMIQVNKVSLYLD